MNTNVTVTPTNSTTLPELFSFKEAELRYRDYVGECKIDAECPGDLLCVNNCKMLFYCNEHDLNRCANNHASDKYFKDCKTNEDCLTNSCVNNKCSGRLIFAAVGNNRSHYGFEEGEKCDKDSECFDGHCNFGECGNYDMGRKTSKILYASLGLSATLIIVCIAFYLYKKKNKESN
ncbi:hypothetical protein PIROE2DRAFT_66751 [Piromyces sp. E2]|nr:hypothetical protein PIROE2DRAFT_66751 [Piromyces sp. E2]|eukprot:OUM70003.1 hypothetical protein PIROE2DRAFT_66751 [Piromyces sp. E2]